MLPSSQQGSSPLARGLPPCPRGDGRARGIIPARAGFTRASGRPSRHSADHPRSRGVYPAPGSHRGCRWGSSPLARGLLQPVCDAVAQARIIPARAGFTHRRLSAGSPDGDHPRSRGVYFWIRCRVVTAAGSSPLARGLLGAGGAVLLLPGIIPARAGFTPRHPLGGGAFPGSSPLARGLLRPCASHAHAGAGSSPLARGLLHLEYGRRPP